MAAIRNARTDVLIENCEFDTGDDCIAIKSGRNRDGRRVAIPSQNIIVRNCVMKDGHGGVTIGSEASGDVRNVFVENCKLDSPQSECASCVSRPTPIAAAKSRTSSCETVRGSGCWRCSGHRSVLRRGRGRSVYAGGEKHRDGRFTCDKSKYAVSLKGYKSDPLRDITLTRCTFDHVEKENLIQNVTGLHVERCFD